ncbi:DUF502 domain-containing protein [Haloarculaceae archaeon H-GB2-1]|nr:DUF502 domain-containing protein [Haloarculaceae archaeon H-GB1-1]MEA5385821.1 DUF502 domain-containing protein [Haloarculaceae archaeon H-GB11]MEA5407321.1 DUF502 domain-containing protein [Haloarculaceae archaeon H-GB2-1]
MGTASWKRDLASGLIVLIPLLVTLYIILWLYAKLAAVPLPIENPLLRAGLAMTIFVLMVFSVGYLMRTAFGGSVEDGIDQLMNQLPGLRVVYNASKMAVETAVSGTEDLQKPVKVEPWEGMRMTAFKTGKTTEDGREVIFLPTAPNITTGFVIEVEPENISETGEKVEDALTRILSAGFGDANEQEMPVDIEADD